MMTHCVGVLVVSELHQCRAVFRLSGFVGLLSLTALASLWVHAAARVLPHAGRAAPTTRWDVLLVGVCSDGCSSVLRQKRKWWGNETSAFHLTLSVAHFGLPSSAWHGLKCFRKLNGKVILIRHLLIPSPAANVMFSFSANSIYRLFTVHALIDISAVFGLRHSSNPCVTDLSAKSPSTRISFLQRWLQLLWLCCVSVDELTTQKKKITIVYWYQNTNWKQ